MAIPDGAILRVVASLLFPESVIAQNIFYAVFADTGGSDDDADVLSDLADYVEDMFSELDTQVADEIALDSIKVYIYDPLDPDWDEVGDELLTDAFANAEDMSPHGISMVIHAKTTNPDVQAAKYLGGFGETSTVDGLWGVGALTAAANFANTWTTAFVGAATGGDFAPGVWSPTKLNFFIFNGVEVVGGIPGYQRRRKPGVGI